MIREAAVPPEARGLARDDVRLAVVTSQTTTHTTVRHLGEHLRPGDLLVVNTSGTLPSAIVGERWVVHVSTGLDDGSWVVELRQPDNSGPATPVPGERLELPGGVSLRIVAPHPAGQARLWRAVASPAVDRVDYLTRWGRPIHYRYVHGEWPLDALQNAYARHPGSAEMPSAGRPLTERLLVSLMASGVVIAPVVLHTGVASQEKHEPPQPEEYAVPAATARLVGSTRAAGRRVVAVGTTVVRALESAAAGGPVGPLQVVPSAGWTSLVLDPSRPARVVDGLLTGLHEPEASHLHLLAAVAGRTLVDRGYADLDGPGAPAYLWHEFGDAMLLLP
ncbi:queuosine biosynthesis protein [Nocardioides sp. Root1257]|uniref:S-adenosylmethionine:tRNA ribosyltransferase-isomerase n=1 Tax=unclassified Nocardioides TaxID=2615069 RepID=UPI0006FE6FA3|nr:MULTISPECIES: S-adenosylmethionine:tRNA ribosyltransferase-isomerase [unclassified Nocardioides]KQW53179.1 queuosine biosynthesis protein [Nocardioides sp. Root1257]KRC55866.1 queuosine biosynthesis protein [Nocardioides sp. Root224]